MADEYEDAREEDELSSPLSNTRDEDELASPLSNTRNVPAPPTPSQQISATIPKPKPLKAKPTLANFRYLNTPFPKKPNKREDDSSAKNLTAIMIQNILDGTRFDQANTFFLENQTVVRFFEPRQHLNQGGGAYKQASFQLSEPHHARAMAWHLTDSGSRPGMCTTCKSELSHGPFKACIIPDDPDAGGSCTNCWYMKRPASCSHRPVAGRPVSPLKKAGKAFDGFTGQDMLDATDANLAAWKERIEVELRVRGETQKVKVARGPKRAADDDM